MHSWITVKLLIAAGLAMLALGAGAHFGRAMRRVARSLALMRRSVLAALAALAVVCAVEADKNRGGSGNAGPVERVERVEERDEGLGMRYESGADGTKPVPPGGNMGGPRSPSLSLRVGSCTARATDKRQVLVAASSPRSGASGYTVSAEDIARGWRVESVTTNATFGYQGEYSNVVEKMEWHIRGGRDMRFGLDLGGFVFPLGSNEVTRVCVLSGGTIWTLPPISPKATIGAAQEWASFAPGTSHFWSADADNGAKLLTWENVYANRDGTGQFSAQIELHESGDFVLRYDNVETVCRRVNPDDWDGDGLANDLDANPLTCGGDNFGTSAAWYNANCAGVMSAYEDCGTNIIEWNEGVCTNAYYWLDLAVSGVKGVSTIHVNCDGPSSLGDMTIIARTNEVCHIPMLVGATYTIESDLLFASVAASDGRVRIDAPRQSGKWWCRATFPLYFWFVKQGGDCYCMTNSPICVGAVLSSVTGGCCSCEVEDGCFSWSCDGGCSCGGGSHDLWAVATWEGYSKNFQWQANCPCHGVPEEPSDWLSMDLPSVVFVNNDDDDEDGVPDAGDLYVLEDDDIRLAGIQFSPPVSTNGTLTLRQISGTGDIALWSDWSKETPYAMPHVYSAEAFSSATFFVEGTGPSAVVGGVAFEWEFADSSGWRASVTQAMTVAEVKWLHMMSSVAGQSPNPPPFNGQRLCPFSVTNSLNLDRHMVIPFQNVVNTNDFSVVDFYVDMRLELNPHIVLDGVDAVWTVLAGTPPSGSIVGASGLSARFANPKLGGVYRFSATYAGSPVTECNLVLPLAGASVDAVAAADLVAASNTVAVLDATVGEYERQSPFWGLKWFNNNGMGDYLGRVDNASKPTVWRYNQVNDESGMGAVATWCGLPIRMAKLSNFMVGYATTRLGVWSVSQSLSQSIGTLNDASAQMSWDAGVAVANGGDFTSVTANMVTNAWHVSDSKERSLWPNTSSADNHVQTNGVFDFNINFCSPGFIERGRNP